MERPLIERVIFHGNDAIETETLEETVLTQASECKSLLVRPICLITDSPTFVNRHYLDRDELQRDVIRLRVLYWRSGYRSAEVDTAVVKTADEAVRVVFTIREGPPTIIARDTIIRPGTVLTEEQVSRAMLVREGQPLDLFALDSSLAQLRHVLWDEGYADAQVDSRVAVDDSADLAVLAIAIDPGPLTIVDSILIRGNRKVSDATIMRSLVMKPGERFRRSDLIQSQRNLYTSNLFDQAQIDVPGTQDSTKVVVVLVNEAPFNAVGTGAGFNTVDFVQVEGRYTRYNFLGGGRRVDLHAAVGNLFARQLRDIAIFQFEDLTQEIEGVDLEPFLQPTWQASVDFTQPWFLNARNSLGAALFAHRRSMPGVYVDRGYGASATFTREVVPRGPLSLNYRFERSLVEAGGVYFCVSFGVCNPLQVRALQMPHRLAPLSLGGFVNRTDQALAPTQGWRAQLDLEHASSFTYSEFRYNRFYGEGSYYRPMGNRRVLALGARVGYVRPLESTAEALGLATERAVIHPRKRFYAGGSRSVRGFSENQLGPRVLTIPFDRLDESAQAACLALIDAPADQGAREACQAGIRTEPSESFVPHPTGGTSLLSASAEFRFPLTDNLTGAAFVDGAFVGVGGLSDIMEGSGAITPGVGLRLDSPVGPVRVDLAYRPVLVERLEVITSPPNSNRLVELGVVKNYDPLEGASWVQQVLRRLTLHLAIGQAF